ncbi:hypothetical protein X742_32445 [Mesorhizobium sp. LNHC232B00]|nr:hypothetical protein X742_32445 [Mesorhizobium sp. LNHC232B00]
MAVLSLRILLIQQIAADFADQMPQFRVLVLNDLCQTPG